MKLKLIFTMLLGLLSSAALSSETWGPELIEFDLEGGEKIQTMLWISGWSYSTTEHLQALGCLKADAYVGGQELIIALNKAYAGERITSEAATVQLARYIRAAYPCAAYNKKLQPTANAPAE